MINIIIGGDVCPMGKVEKLFVNGKAKDIYNDLLEDIVNTDLSVINLECPLISQNTPIEKIGDLLSARVECVKGLVEANCKVVNLANNHSYDHGHNGFLETINALKRAGLSTVGAGLTIKEAQIPFITTINNQRIVIYSMAEREFSIADDNTAGSNPLDLINLINAIKLHKQKDIFIVLIHGGNEYFPYPSPEFVRRSHFMIDMGADAVVCCHSHCPLPWEIYSNRPIIYGLGNLIFEATNNELESWYEGYLAKLTIYNHQINFEAIPYYQSKGFYGAKKMDVISKNRFFSEMKMKNDQIKDVIFLEKKWNEFCLKKRDTYLSGLFGYNRCMRKARKLLLKTLHSKKDVLCSLHYVQCEAHQEVLNTIFRNERTSIQE